MAQQKHSLKPLPKSKRERKRYILFELKSSFEIGFNELKKALEEALLSLYSANIVVEINARLVKFNSKKNRGILKCKRGSEQRTRKALEQLMKVHGKPIIVRTLRCSGSLAKLQQSL